MKQEINNETLDNIDNIIADVFKEHKRFVAEMLEKHTKEEIIMDVLISYDCFFKYLCTYDSDLDIAIEVLKEDYNIIDEEEVLKFFIAEFKNYINADCQDRYRPID
jgi:hypothetical protein